MCGILAILTSEIENKKYWLEKIPQLLNKMSHRGPDAEKIETFNSVILGHRRLSILDLSEAGNQPMVSKDGRYSIVLNGEIYNYLEIREELIKKGHKFTTTTDTEVLLAAYAEYGIKIFELINGMYSFIIWDNEQQELLVARDRFGIKPLFYSRIGDDLVFSSEIKPINMMKKMRGKPLEPNHSIIFDFLIYSTVDHSNETFFKNIYRFPAGHYTIIQKGKMDKQFDLKQYWDLKEEIKQLKEKSEFKERTKQEHIDKVLQLFLDSVKLRLRSDVQVGSCLSGGIDSSSIVSVISKNLKGNLRNNFETFSMVYDEWFEKTEKNYIDLMIKTTGFKANFTTPSVTKIEDSFDQFLYYQEEPVTGLSPIGQFFVMELAREKGTTVLLDGQGADEILAGYKYLRGFFLFDLFKRFKIFKLLKELWTMKSDFTTLKYFFAQFFPKFILKFLRKQSFKDYLAGDFVKRFTTNIPRGLVNVRKPFSEMLINLLTIKLPHLLRWEDKSSMRFSIEARVPFLDHNLVKYILALPSEYIIKNGVTKWIFRDAMEDITPAEILERRDKIGFAVPEKTWLYAPEFTLFDDLKQNPHNELKKIIDMEKITNLSKKREEKKLTQKELKFLFCVACLNKWFTIFFNKNDNDDFKIS